MVMKTRLLLVIAIAGLLLPACNPECESIAAVNIDVPPGPYLEGSELAIEANPASLLQGRRILMSFDGNMEDLETRYEADLGATIVRLPEEISSNASLVMDDPDCTGQLIPIGTSSGLVDASFFVDNPYFITPTPPLVIIPSPPVVTPPNIINAWFSPNNRDYCIWFKPEEDADGNEKSNLIPAIATSPNTITNGPPDGSAELAVGCGGNPATDRFYHANPVTGIVDKVNNYIRIKIDRTSKGLGVEEFEGQFIDPSQLPADTDYAVGGTCSPDGSQKPHIMLLTSLETGRQMILWRGLD